MSPVTDNDKIKNGEWNQYIHYLLGEITVKSKIWLKQTQQKKHAITVSGNS